jgi:hypothetical protein
MRKFALIIFTPLVISCKTYTVNTESLKAQFKAIALAADQARHAKDLNEIKAQDKDQNIMIKNSPSIEIRLTDLKGIKHHFYFNSLQLRNEMLIGDEIGFWRTKVRKIPTDSIQKAEIKNGRKVK